MIQKPRQCITHIFFRLDAVMECNDGTGPGSLNGTAQAMVRRNVFGIIMGKYVPHNNRISFQGPDLTALDPTIRWTEEFSALYLTPCPSPGGEGGWHVLQEFHFTQSCIFQILCHPVIPTFQMIKGVVANGMALANDVLKNRRMLAHIFSDTKKSCFRMSLFQFIEHKFRGTGNGAIVKRQVKLFFSRRHSPPQTRIEPGEKKRCSEDHGILF